MAKIEAFGIWYHYQNPEDEPVETVFYTKGLSTDWVKRDLTLHDGWPTSIIVKKRNRL